LLPYLAAAALDGDSFGEDAVMKKIMARSLYAELDARKNGKQTAASTHRSN